MQSARAAVANADLKTASIQQFFLSSQVDDWCQREEDLQVMQSSVRWDRKLLD